MKDLSLVSNEVLHALTLTSSKSEKTATLFLLEHLAEVNERRLYAVMGYGSLWEYVSLDHKSCENRTSLQFDHQVPHAKGGENTFENLRHYCANHNRLWAIQSYGSKKMGQFLKSHSSSNE